MYKHLMYKNRKIYNQRTLWKWLFAENIWDIDHDGKFLNSFIIYENNPRPLGNLFPKYAKSNKLYEG